MREHTALLLACILLLVGLSLPLTEPDEVRYSEIPAAMEASGDWVVPRLHGQPYLDKPPLHYWAVAGMYRLAGPGPAVARLPSTLAAALTALAVWVLGRRLVGSRHALMATAVLLLLPGFQVAAHYANLDAVFTLFLTVAQLTLWIGLRQAHSDLRWVAAGGVAAGLAILTKGPAALAIVVPPVLAWDWLRSRRPRFAAWALFTAIALGVAAPWFAAISGLEPGFWRHFLWRHHLQRALGTLEHQRPWWFFGPIFLAGVFPYTFWLPPALRDVFLPSREARARRAEGLGIAVLATAWPVALFSLSSGKLPSYILPAFPFAAIVVGWYLEADLEDPRRAVRRSLMAFAGAGVLALVVLWLDLASRPYFAPADRGVWVVWLVVWGVGLAAVWVCEMPPRRTALLAAVLLNAQIFATTLPAMATRHSLAGRAALHARRLARDGHRLEIVVLADDGDPFLLQAPGPVPVSHVHPQDHPMVERLLEGRRELVLVTEPEHLDWLRGQPERYAVREIDGRGHVFHARFLAAGGEVTP